MWNNNVGDIMEDPLFERFSNDSPSLYEIVKTGNLIPLKEWARHNQLWSVFDRKRNNALHLAVMYEQKEVFDYLINLHNDNIDFPNSCGHTALCIAVKMQNMYMVQELLKKRAKIERVCTLRNIKARAAFNPRVQELVFEDVADLEPTPGPSSCRGFRRGSIENMQLLLCFGGDCDVYDRHSGKNFEKIVRSLKLSSLMSLYDVMLDYSISDVVPCMNLCILLLAVKSPVFSQLLDRINRVVYRRTGGLDEGARDFQDFCKCLFAVDHYKNFVLLVKKFPNYFFNILFRYGMTGIYNYIASQRDPDAILAKWTLLLSHLVKNFPKHVFIQYLEEPCPALCVNPNFLPSNLDPFSQKSLTELLSMLSNHDYLVPFSFIIEVFQKYGLKDLFKTCLHMEIDYTNLTPNPFALPYIICTLRSDGFKNLLNPPFLGNFASEIIDCLINYFVLPKDIREYYKEVSKDLSGRPLETRKKLENMSQVPSLLQLARDASREALIEKYNLRSSKEFYDCLDCLPIVNYYKKIIAYEVKVYVHNT